MLQNYQTVYSKTNIKSSFIQAILVGLLILGLFTNIGEIVYILGRSIVISTENLHCQIFNLEASLSIN